MRRLQLFLYLMLLAILGVGTPLTMGQSFTWTANSSGNWSTSANWEAGTPLPPPPGGGSATLALTFAPTATGTITATNDLGTAGAFLLNRLELAPRYGFNTFGTPFFTGLVVAGDTDNPLQFTGADAEMRHQRGGAARVSAPIALLSATTIAGDGHGHLWLSGPISGSSALTINQTGTSQILLGNGTANTYTGGTVLNAGNLSIANTTAGTGIVNTPALGTGPLTINGGSLRFNNFQGNGLGVSNAILANADLVFTGNNSGWFTGVISGDGGVISRPNVGITARFTAANTYTGETRGDLTATATSAGSIFFAGANGSALNSSGFVVHRLGTLTLDNRTLMDGAVAGGGNNTNRIGDSAPVTLHRGNFIFQGNEDADSSEVFGPLRASGFSFVTVTGREGRSAQLIADSFVRLHNGVTVLRGTNPSGAETLATAGTATPGTPGTTNIRFTNSTNLIAALAGGGGAAGTTTISIVPFLLADANASPTSFRHTLATYSVANGVRGLDFATEYAGSLTSGQNTFDNVRLTDAVVGISSLTSINALVLDRVGTSPNFTFGSVDGTGTLRLQSGVILAIGPASGGNQNVLSVADLDFNGREAIITNPELLRIDSRIVNATGLTKSGGNALTLTGTGHTYTGTVTINAGFIDIASEANLGGTGAVVVNGGSLRYTAGGTFSRDLTVGPAAGGLDVTVGNTVTLTGNIGQLEPGGSFVKANSGTLILQGTGPTFTGDTVLSGGELRLTSADNISSSRGLTWAPGTTLRTTTDMTLALPFTLTAGAGVRTLITEGDLTLLGPVGTNGAVTNALGFNKAGDGTLRLNADNSFNGIVNVTAGDLLVNGSLAQLNITGNGVSVATGAGLGGSGVLYRDVQLAADARLTAGDFGGVGQLTIFGNLDAASGQLEWDLAGSSPGQYDRLVLGENALLNVTGANLQLNLLNGYVPAPTDELVLVQILGTGPGAAGLFANDVGGVLTSGDWTWQITYAGGTGNDIVLFNPTPIPEPSALALLGLALVIGRWLGRPDLPRA